MFAIILVRLKIIGSEVNYNISSTEKGSYKIKNEKKIKKVVVVVFLIK